MPGITELYVWLKQRHCNHQGKFDNINRQPPGIRRQKWISGTCYADAPCTMLMLHPTAYPMEFSGCASLPNSCPIPSRHVNPASSLGVWVSLSSPIQFPTPPVVATPILPRFPPGMRPSRARLAFGCQSPSSPPIRFPPPVVANQLQTPLVSHSRPPHSYSVTEVILCN